MGYSNNKHDKYEVLFFKRSNSVKTLFKEIHENLLNRVTDKEFRLNLIKHYNKLSCRVIKIDKVPDQPAGAA